jgi:hypothetical protein
MKKNSGSTRRRKRRSDMRPDYDFRGGTRGKYAVAYGGVMRKDLFDQLVESVKEMKDIQSGRRKPARVTRADPPRTDRSKSQDEPS